MKIWRCKTTRNGQPVVTWHETHADADRANQTRSITPTKDAVTAVTVGTDKAALVRLLNANEAERAQ